MFIVSLKLDQKKGRGSEIFSLKYRYQQWRPNGAFH